MKTLQCKCGNEIKEWSLVVTNESNRTDFELTKDGYKNVDREVFCGDTESIIYRCDCSEGPHKEMIVTNDKEKYKDYKDTIVDENIKDFGVSVDRGGTYPLDGWGPFEINHSIYGSINIIDN